MAIMNVYRPPNLCTEGFIRRLKEAYSAVDDGHIEIWILGDLNIDIMKLRLTAFIHHKWVKTYNNTPVLMLPRDTILVVNHFILNTH